MSQADTIIYWLHPRKMRPPHQVTDAERALALRDGLKKFGWKKGSPALLGYWDHGRIQLISGSHRWAACMSLNIRIPVYVVGREYLRRIWGTEQWVKLVAHPPKVMCDTKIYGGEGNDS